MTYGLSNWFAALYRECLAGAQIMGRGLGHVTPSIFGSTVGYPSDSLASCYILLLQVVQTVNTKCVFVHRIYHNYSCVIRLGLMQHVFRLVYLAP